MLVLCSPVTLSIAISLRKGESINYTYGCVGQDKRQGSGAAVPPTNGHKQLFSALPWTTRNGQILVAAVYILQPPSWLQECDFFFVLGTLICLGSIWTYPEQRLYLLCLQWWKAKQRLSACCNDFYKLSFWICSLLAPCFSQYDCALWIRILGPDVEISFVLPHFLFCELPYSKALWTRILGMMGILEGVRFSS